MIFTQVDFVNPMQSTLALADCPFTEFLIAVVADLNLTTKLGRASNPTIGEPWTIEEHFAMDIQDQASTNSDIRPVKAVFPTVHCV
jgi:hypothetical protein